MKDAVFTFKVTLAICALGVIYCSCWAFAAPDMPKTHSGKLCPAELVSVLDGDTIRVRLPHSRCSTKVRLFAAQCPELPAPDGEAAKARTTASLTGRTVWLESDPDTAMQDRYGRELRWVWFLDDKGWHNLSVDLVRDGLATAYTGRFVSSWYDNELGISRPTEKCK